jgi:hypothetical protein
MESSTEHTEVDGRDADFERGRPGRVGRRGLEHIGKIMARVLIAAGRAGEASQGEENPADSTGQRAHSRTQSARE